MEVIPHSGSFIIQRFVKSSAYPTSWYYPTAPPVDPAELYQFSYNIGRDLGYLVVKTPESSAAQTLTKYAKLEIIIMAKKPNQDVEALISGYNFIASYELKKLPLLEKRILMQRKINEFLPLILAFQKDTN